MYNEEKAKREKAKRTCDLPKKWTHLEFIEELIYDFFLWETDRNRNPTASANASVAASTSAAARTTRQGSTVTIDSTASVATSSTFYDLTTKEGREDWFCCNKPYQMNKTRMEGNFFSRRWDGQFHPSMPCVTYNAYCQYCKWKFNNVVPDCVKDLCKYKNRKDISRCLTCNVNLCWSCQLEWHNMSLNKLSATMSKKPL
jgi:hypothetical protein